MSPDTTEDGTRRRVQADIEVEGVLRLAPNVVYEGRIRAPGGVVVPAGTTVRGDVFTEGDVEVDADARLEGRVRSASPEPEPAEPDGEDLTALVGPLGGDTQEEELGLRLERFAEAVLERPPEGPWPARLVRELLFGQVLATLAPVAVEKNGEDGFVLRVHRPDSALPTGREDPSADVVEAARRLGQAARPSLSLHSLSSAQTPGDVLLLVRP